MPRSGPMSEDQPAEWYYVEATDRHGPVTPEQLGRLVASGKVPRGVAVWRTGFRHWVRADSVAELTAALPPEPGNLVARTFRPSGRFSRSEFATVFLAAQAISLVMGAAVGVGQAYEDPPLLLLPLALAFVPWLLFAIPLTICASIRRLHDLGRSGWFILLFVVPLVGFVLLLYLLFERGQETKAAGPEVPRQPGEPLEPATSSPLEPDEELATPSEWIALHECAYCRSTNVRAKKVGDRFECEVCGGPNLPSADTTPTNGTEPQKDAEMRSSVERLSRPVPRSQEPTTIADVAKVVVILAGIWVGLMVVFGQAVRGSGNTAVVATSSPAEGNPPTPSPAAQPGTPEPRTSTTPTPRRTPVPSATPAPRRLASRTPAASAQERKPAKSEPADSWRVWHGKCLAGYYQYQCMEVARHYMKVKEYKLAAAIYRKLCAGLPNVGQRAAACANFGVLHEGPWIGTPNPAFAMEHYTEACVLGNSQACKKLEGPSRR